jgi:hypothetical protein
VGVEKVAFQSKQPKLGDGKCLAEQRKSFVGHPDAIYFWRICGKWVSQQPRLLTTVTARLGSPTEVQQSI